MNAYRATLADWILSCALPASQREAVLGDLEEELALRHDVARWWYWQQIIRSLPRFLWMPVRRGGTAHTLAVALAACATQAAIELSTNQVIGALVPKSDWVLVLTLTIVLPSLLGTSYVAARLRPGAATLQTVIVLLAASAQVVLKEGDGVPLWIRLSLLFVGPALTFAGGVLSVRMHEGSGRRSY